MNKKLLIWLIFALVLGALGGYYLGKKNQKTTTMSFPSASSSTKEAAVSSPDNQMINLKLDLLRLYTNFVFLPKEKIDDQNKYADEMGAKIKAINDNDLTAKFYATGETVNKEQKIIDFLNSLIDSAKKDVNK